MVTNPFNHSRSATIAHPKPLTGLTRGKQTAPRRTIQHGISNNGIICRDNTGF
jgi:hypothetical protein